MFLGEVKGKFLNKSSYYSFVKMKFMKKKICKLEFKIFMYFGEKERGLELEVTRVFMKTRDERKFPLRLAE